MSENEKKTLYNVSVECDGQDCDGPISHGVDKFEMTRAEIAQRIGFAMLRHGNGQITAESTYEKGEIILFNNHDEGFSRTHITWDEIEADCASDADFDAQDRLAYESEKIALARGER
jgi:hypothetical protein